MPVGDRLFDAEDDDSHAPRTIRYYISTNRPIVDENHKWMRRVRQHRVLLPSPDAAAQDNQRGPTAGEGGSSTRDSQPFVVGAVYQKLIEYVRFSRRQTFSHPSLPCAIVLVEAREWVNWEPKRQAFSAVRERREVEVQMKVSLKPNLGQLWHPDVLEVDFCWQSLLYVHLRLLCIGTMILRANSASHRLNVLRACSMIEQPFISSLRNIG